VTEGRLLLVRHGETEWSRLGRHTGRTDLALTPRGELQASSLEPLLVREATALVLVSPLERARRTADLAGLARSGSYDIDDDLVEWDYGEYEGLTTAEIRERAPGWTIWTQPCPGGETSAHVSQRCDRVVTRVLEALGRGDVVVVAHGHLLRSLASRWLGLPVSGGAGLELGTAALCVLGEQYDARTIVRWNIPNPAEEEDAR
jgi:probable phosphoglycerate mutase